MMATYTHAPHRPAKTDGRFSPGTKLNRGKQSPRAKRRSREASHRSAPAALVLWFTKVTPYPSAIPLPDAELSCPCYLGMPPKKQRRGFPLVDTIAASRGPGPGPGATEPVERDADIRFNPPPHLLALDAFAPV
ncbi:hypothetical protein J3F83DRAFT_749056 [Trichoderma novae-zelandiae]